MDEHHIYLRYRNVGEIDIEVPKQSHISEGDEEAKADY